MTLTHGSITIDIERITPAIAQDILDNHNPGNRSQAPALIASYADDMVSGRWLFTGDPVHFTAEGDLLSGQHRLAAIILSGIPQDVVVVRGFPYADRHVLDVGRKRTTGDFFASEGRRNYKTLASVTSLVVHHTEGRLPYATSHSSYPLSTARLRDAEAADPTIEWAAGMAVHHRSIPTPPSAVGFAAWLIRSTTSADVETIERFFDDLSEMRTSGEGDPKSTVLRRLTALRVASGSVKSSLLAHLIVRAWNAERKGEPLYKITVPTPASKTKFAVAL